MTEEDKVLRFLLPDLLGKPAGLTLKNGEIVFPSGFEIPPDNYVFFISVEEWREFRKVKELDK